MKWQNQDQSPDTNKRQSMSEIASGSDLSIETGKAMSSAPRAAEREPNEPSSLSPRAPAEEKPNGTIETATPLTTSPETLPLFAGDVICSKTADLNNSKLLPKETSRKLLLPAGIKPYYLDEKNGIAIICGDCREILPTLADCSVDFIFTDPPYGHNNNNNGDLIHRREAALGRPPCVEDPPLARPIANDGPEANALVKWAFLEFHRILVLGGCCCCGGGGGPDPQFARWSLWLDEAMGFKQMVVWDKGPIGMGWHYRRSYECVLVGEKAGAACRWFDETDKVENIIRNVPKIIPGITDHPTPKPEALPAHFIKLHSQPGHLVVDAFMGAGTTLRAAKELGRRAIGIEIEEKYCEIAAKRLSQEVLNFEVSL